MLRNLTADFEQWGRMDDLYEANLDGSVHYNIVYGLWQPMLGVCGIGRIYCKKQVLIQNH